jgi:hypothetical protein
LASAAPPGRDRLAARFGCQHLIRHDKERVEQEAFDRLKAELARAFAVPEASYQPLTAAEVIARNKA